VNKKKKQIYSCSGQEDGMLINVRHVTINTITITHIYVSEAAEAIVGNG
jgi:hypothetical protein